MLARLYANGAETRGEFVVVVAPPAEEERADDVDALLKRALSRVSVKDAVGEVAVATGRPRREIYQRALALTKDDENGTRVNCRHIPKGASRDQSGRRRFVSGFPPKAGRPRSSSRKDSAFWPGGGGVRSARSISLRDGADFWCSPK